MNIPTFEIIGDLIIIITFFMSLGMLISSDFTRKLIMFNNSIKGVKSDITDTTLLFARIAGFIGVVFSIVFWFIFR